MADAAIINCLISNMLSLVEDELSFLWCFKNQILKLSSTLSCINAVLKDADRRRLKEKDDQMKDWLRKLKDVAYEVRDIIDECTTEQIRHQVKSRNASSSSSRQVINSILTPFSDTLIRLKINHKIKDVQEKLDQVSFEREKLHLRETREDEGKTEYSVGRSRETMSILTESCIYGRDDELKQIVDILVEETNAARNLSILPIVGIGGLGKTTLAQMIFNDEQVLKHFNPRFWVCVSEEFDINQVLKAIIENETRGALSISFLENLQMKVRDILKGKRYLIVLDDVWNENQSKWDDLKDILNCGSEGAFILTTTRKLKVAEIMRTAEPIHLSSLSNDDSWLLFKERAFMNGIPQNPNLIDIGREIARKCKGVPLVAKTLGSQLKFKMGSKEWCRIRDNGIWEQSLENNSILPILKLSYFDLPYELRRCFAYCAIFPKDTNIKKQRLIQFWMAHDLVPTIDNLELEDVGNMIWNELFLRSFFEESTIEQVSYLGQLHTDTCKMHDLMHDLALSIMEDECYIMEATSSNVFKKGIRHITVCNDFSKTTTNNFLEQIGSAKGLQSIILCEGFVNNQKLANVNMFDLLKQSPSLRVLETIDAKRANQVLGCVGYLKHLRYLNLSRTEITTIPNSICRLWNLQTLNLNNCYNLVRLPKNMKDLISLRHLYLMYCNQIKSMPPKMGQLTRLQTLSLFVIGKERDCQVDQLKELDLRGYLRIMNLERISDITVATGVNLDKRLNLRNLELHWEYDEEEDKDKHDVVAEALKGPISLENLRMTGYKGVNLPKWLGKLHSLRYLFLSEMENIEHIFVSESGNDNGVLLPKLEMFHIKNMMNLRDLVSPTTTERILTVFPSLFELSIAKCPKLKSLSNLKSLKVLIIHGDGCDELLYNISNLSGLVELFLFGFKTSVSFPEGMFQNHYATLKTLQIRQCDLLEEPPLQLSSTLGSFLSLRELEIWACPKLSHLFDEEMVRLTSLEKLMIWDCHNLVSLSRGGVTRMDSLKHLILKDCPNLMLSLEEWENIISVECLSIYDCPMLVPLIEADYIIPLIRSHQARIGRDFKVDFLK
ncbi:putative disease resistance protein RGA3 [Impatiens glandulifera]|uniref:putative disease resistance protein RGA3 n=1 Tax=Impatiens glandulifera TaxID=253017 RepID=UPI001FB1832E|nr:putative disease resistance protein RGA3 [Impatiens glandulifera]